MSDDQGRDGRPKGRSFQQPAQGPAPAVPCPAGGADADNEGGDDDNDEIDGRRGHGRVAQPEADHRQAEIAYVAENGDHYEGCDHLPRAPHQAADTSCDERDQQMGSADEYDHLDRIGKGDSRTADSMEDKGRNEDIIGNPVQRLRLQVQPSPQEKAQQNDGKYRHDDIEKNH